MYRSPAVHQQQCQNQLCGSLTRTPWLTDGDDWSWAHSKVTSLQLLLIPPFLVRANWHCKTSGPHHPVTSTKNAGVKRWAGKHLPSFSYVNQRQILWGWNFTHTHKYFSCSSWAACLGLAIPFGEGERAKRRGGWDRWRGEKVGETDGNEYFKSPWKRKEYVTHSSPKLRNEKLHKLLFIASSYTLS